MLMIISNAQRGTIGPVTNLLQVYTASLSSVPALVAFRLLIDGVQLTPVGGFNGKEIKTFSLSSLQEGEVTYERVAAYLVNNELNLAITTTCIPIQITPTITGYTRTVSLSGKNNPDGAGCIKIPITGDIVCKERALYCEGEYDTAIFEFLFVPRNQMEELPPEFNAFRVWNNWLTLGKSYASVANIHVDIQEENNVFKVTTEPKHPQLLDTIKCDLQVLASIFG